MTSAILSLFTTSTPASAKTPPPADRITLEVQTVNGSGCPAGTAKVTTSPDGTSFRVTYSQFVAQVGPNAKPTDIRKNCQINLLVHIPQGFTYAIAQATYRGYANVASGSSVMERANYYFSGQTPTERVSHPIPGPYRDYWRFTDTTDIASLVYAPCGKDHSFNINAELRATAGPSTPPNTASFITMQSTSGDVYTDYQLSWKECDR
nr:DUF4360 domain-containing protein [Amycolatopsis anabasis]